MKKEDMIFALSLLEDDILDEYASRRVSVANQASEYAGTRKRHRLAALLVAAAITAALTLTVTAVTNGAPFAEAPALSGLNSDSAKGARRAMTDEMKESFFRLYMRSSGSGPEKVPGKEELDALVSTYYANAEIDGYTLCRVAGEKTNPEFAEYMHGEYYFTRDDSGNPSPLQLYLYKDGEFTTIEDALEQELVSAADVYSTVMADQNYEVEARVFQRDPHPVLGDVPKGPVENTANKQYMDSLGDIRKPTTSVEEHCLKYHNRTKQELIDLIKADLKNSEKNIEKGTFGYTPCKIYVQTIGVAEMEYDESGKPIRFNGIDVENVVCTSYSMRFYLAGMSDMVAYTIYVADDESVDGVVDELNARHDVVFAHRSYWIAG